MLQCGVYHVASVSQGAGRPEIGQELVAQADHKIPDVAGHLWASDKYTPDEDQENGVEGIADVS